MSDLGAQLEVVSRLVVWGAVSAQREHAPREAGQVAHLPLQVPVLPLANEGQAAIGLPDQVALNGLVCVRGQELGEVCVCEGGG